MYTSRRWVDLGEAPATLGRRSLVRAPSTETWPYTGECSVFECWADLETAEAAVAALESVYAPQTEVPCSMYGGSDADTSGLDADLTIAKLVKGGAAEGGATTPRLVVFAPGSIDGLNVFFLYTALLVVCCGCYYFLCCRAWWCRSRWRKIRRMQHF